MIRAQNGAVYNRNIRPIPELTTDIQEDPVEIGIYTAVPETWRTKQKQTVIKNHLGVPEMLEGVTGPHALL